MDIATIIGLVLGFGLILLSIVIGGSNLTPFIDFPSMMIVIGGAFAATLINFPLKSVTGTIAVLMKCFLFKLPDPIETIAQFKELATIAKRDGLLAVEQKLDEVKDDFMKRGIESLVGGATPDQMRAALETEVSYIEARHTLGKKIVDSMGAAAPAFGMIGTLIGLVLMLKNLDDPSQIGGGMATALLTTLYGAMIANIVCIPMAGKLEARNNEETLIRELMIGGICALGEGVSPRAIEEQLAAFLSPKSRDSGKKKK